MAGRRALMRRENHLRNPNEFSFVYRSGRRVRTGSVVAVSAAGPGDTPKVGFAASKKLGNAVWRNRARRRLRAAADPLVGSLAPGSLVVLQATPATTVANFQKLEADVRAALTQTGAIGA